jgi:hypothetical protein
MVARLCVEEAMTAAVMDGVEVEDGVGQKFGSWLLFYTGDGAVQTSYMFRVGPPHCLVSRLVPAFYGTVILKTGLPCIHLNTSHHGHTKTKESHLTC